jgi:hypothetical protein
MVSIQIQENTTRSKNNVQRLQQKKQNNLCEIGEILLIWEEGVFINWICFAVLGAVIGGFASWYIHTR